MYKQISDYVEKFLSPYIFGYRKGHSTEQCLLKMLEIWKKAADEKRFAGAILTDLSKAFDCLNHDLLIAKLNAYEFDLTSLQFIRSYFTERKQRTQVDSSYSSWKELSKGVPQGSILGPLIFNIFLNDIFYFASNSNIANYADDNSIYATNNTKQGLLDILEAEATKVLKWFHDNEMKANEDKCHLFIIKNNEDTVKLGNEEVIAEKSIKLLGLTIDSQLNFKEHVSELLKKKVTRNFMLLLQIFK